MGGENGAYSLDRVCERGGHNLGAACTNAKLVLAKLRPLASIGQKANKHMRPSSA